MVAGCGSPFETRIGRVSSNDRTTSTPLSVRVRTVGARVTPSLVHSVNLFEQPTFVWARRHLVLKNYYEVFVYYTIGIATHRMLGSGVQRFWKWRRT